MAAVRASVLTPTPTLTITFEATARGEEVHLHPGGQGVWQARLLCTLGAEVSLCGRFAGEAGTVVRALLEAASVQVSGPTGEGTNGAYVHDRREGQRQVVAGMAASPLSRHEADDLYGQMLVTGRAGDVCFLAGPDQPDVVPDGFYARLTADLRDSVIVVVDLSGRPLTEVLETGPTVVKVSDEELASDGRTADGSPRQLAAGMERMAARGVGHVLVTRGDKPALALVEGRWWMATAPSFTAVDPSGAGDSFTAAYGATLAAGDPVHRCLQVASAAGALNTTRHGLASGDRDAIERLADDVAVQPVDRTTIDRMEEGEPCGS